jgi:hypothetical protein
MYCQSNLVRELCSCSFGILTCEMFRIPSPSLLKLPPNKFVRMAALLPVAFCEAKQGIETELSQGIMYAGRIWYKAIPPNEYQKYRILLDDLKSSQWRLWRVVTRGMLVQYTASGAMKSVEVHVERGRRTPYGNWP